MAMAGLILGYFGVSIVPILIVAAIAIPNLMRAKIQANESAAVGSLRTLNEAVEADLIDLVLASGVKSGYVFRYEVAEGGATGGLTAYTIVADPVTQGTTGQRHFFTDESAVIRIEINGPATNSSPPLEGTE
jgi:type IV pilus assembly protein PilA